MSDEGCLWLVATPIGNLADLSPRARDCLDRADAILAEDTRRARQLLSHLGLKQKTVVRFDANVEARGCQHVVERLQQGERLALLSDAGSPLISDPGAALVRAVAAAGLRVSPIAGPSAVIAAASASGLVSGGFRFLGFLPRATGPRRAALELLQQTREAAILFESPRRLNRTLAELAALMPERAAVVARELTKLHEELIRGSLQELLARHGQRSWQGEITLVLGPWSQQAKAELTAEDLEQLISHALAGGLRTKEAAKALSLQTGIPAAQLYRRIVARRR